MGSGTADAVIVGGGFAGAMTAAALVADGLTNVILVEQEAVPGFHASGRNAAIARRIAEHPAVTALASRSLELMGSIVDADGRPVLRRTGGVLLGRPATLSALRDRIEPWGAATEALIRDIRQVPALELAAEYPWLDTRFGDEALVTRDCGVVDIHALLQDALQRAPRALRLRRRLVGVETARGAIAGVRLDDGATIATPRLINAAGFGLNHVARLAGARPVPLNPVRRHLLTTTAHHAIASDAPWFWHVDAGWYLRREGAGLLMCACDATPWPEDAPMDPPRDPGLRELAAGRFTDALPQLEGVSFARDWAGLRVLTPDGAFILGPDPEIEGLVWVGGLGGHGMTTSCGVGEFASRVALGLAVDPHLEAAFAPGRFRALA